MRMDKIFDNRGASIVIFTTALTLIMGFAALVVDVGMVALEKQRFQNAIDAATLAAAQELPDEIQAMQTANKYLQLNGCDESNVNIEFSDNNIELTANKEFEFFFAKALGVNNKTATIHASASTESLGTAFNYSLFSGSQDDTLRFNGSNFYIEGNIHSNDDFRANGSNLTITGACEAVTTININGSNINVGSEVPDASYIEMPDFSKTIILQAEQNDTIYYTNKNYNNSYIDVDSSIYVDGDITINGSHFEGQGCMLATDDITFNGSNLNQSSDDAVCFYSENGDITINGSNAQLEGIIYAPNGTVNFNGSNQTINGRVIANEIRFNGSSASIISGTTELNSLPSHGVKLVR